MTKPTAKELIESIEQGYVAPTHGYDVLAARVEKVLALHVQGIVRKECRQCGFLWPCSTVKILDGKSK